MHNATSPSLIDPNLPSIPGLLAARVERAPDGVFCELKTELGGSWTPMTTRTFADRVVAVACGLIAHGIEPGDRVAIMARTRFEWTLLDFAIWHAGAVPVPIYETSSTEQITWILSDAGVRLAIVETTAHAEATRAAGDVPVLVIDDGAIDVLVTEGHDVLEAEVERRAALTTAEDLATIIYTSGTTGRPKGAELTHGNFTSLALEGAAGLHEIVGSPGSRTLLFLPLAHVFARYIEVMCVASGAVMGHTPSVANLLSDLGSFRPTFLLAVPRVFEKVYNSAEQKATASPVRLRLFRWSARVAIAYSRQLDAGQPSAWTKARLAIADALVLHKLRDAMGGHLIWAISGGAPLGERLGHFYRGMGLRVLEGYGLTETTAPTAVNMPAKSKIGSVGPPFPGASIRIAEDGEIEVSGSHVFRGYHGNPEATAEVLDDGWFRTGDLGALDDDGYLTITGRKKEIIVTAAGKNVAPAVLEDRLRGHPLVSQVVLVGDQRPFIAALVTLDAEMLPGWLAGHGLPQMSVAEAAGNHGVLAALDRAVARTNGAVSRAESIRKIKVLDIDFTEANGYLTPSTKVKRALVLNDFADAVDEIYATGPSRPA